MENREAHRSLLLASDQQWFRNTHVPRPPANKKTETVCNVSPFVLPPKLPNNFNKIGFEKKQTLLFEPYDKDHHINDGFLDLDKTPKQCKRFCGLGEG